MTVEERESLMIQVTTHNLAKIANDSVTVKHLLDLGVEVFRWETKNQLDLALRMDHRRDVRPKVKYLSKTLGLSQEVIATLFSLNPGLILEDLEVLRNRVLYLNEKNFSARMIREILSGNPFWLDMAIPDLDARLGFLQKSLSLSGDGLRQSVVRHPRLVTWAGLPNQFNVNKIAMKVDINIKVF